MKTIVLLTALTLSTSALAADSNFYLKANAGAHRLNNIKNAYNERNVSFKHKAKVSPVGGVAIGYNFNEKLRADISFNYLTAAYKKDTQDTSLYYRNRLIISNFMTIYPYKTQIHTVMLNAYTDVIDNGVYEVFVGAGAGLARINEEQTYTTAANKGMVASRIGNSFAYSFTAGASTRVATDMKVEVAYHYNNYGKSRPNKTDGVYDTPRNPYKGSHVTLGLRYDI